MGQLGFILALELRNDPLGKNFAQLHAPLVERIDIPDDALREHAVFVERDQFAQRLRRQPFARIMFEGRFPSKPGAARANPGCLPP